jgi:dUTP pyrophosphatase
MLEVKIKPERENFQLPIKGTPEAACYDCFISKIEVAQDNMVICYLGFSTEIPKGYKGLVIPRSNITKYGWVMPNGIGIIDSDYRNEWQARFRSIPNRVNRSMSLCVSEFPYKIGERCCQITFEKVNDIKFDIVNSTSETERGLGGFGSTGK